MAAMLLTFVWFLRPGAVDLARPGTVTANVIMSSSVVLVVVLASFSIALRLKKSIVLQLEADIKRSVRRNGRIPEDMVDDLVHIGENANSGMETQFVLDTIDRIAEYAQQQ